MLIKEKKIGVGGKMNPNFPAIASLTSIVDRPLLGPTGNGVQWSSLGLIPLKPTQANEYVHSYVPEKKKNARVGFPARYAIDEVETEVAPPRQEVHDSHSNRKKMAPGPKRLLKGTWCSPVINVNDPGSESPKLSLHPNSSRNQCETQIDKL